MNCNQMEDYMDNFLSITKDEMYEVNGGELLSTLLTAFVYGVISYLVYRYGIQKV